MKYHVNPETGTVGACRAKKRCPFGGDTGQENHFASKGAAESAAEALMKDAHSTEPFKKPSSTSVDKEFTVKKAAIAKALKNAGVIKPGQKIPSVKNEQELVQKWFNGDRAKYELISKVAAHEELKAGTKKSVGKFLNQSVDVTMIDSVNFDQAEMPGKSNVDLIDDYSDGPITLEDLKSGKLKAFK